MATMKAISAALKLIDVKKESLRKAFEDLQLHSSSLSSFTLTWSDLDSYFSSLQSSLEFKFKLLQTLDLQQPPLNQARTPSHSAVGAENSPESVPNPARPELKSFCENMDGLGLRKYVNERPSELTAIRLELIDAFRSAPDAAAMILSAVEGWSIKADGFVSSSCLVLLEELLRLKPEIGAELKERAMKLAVEWKGKIVLGSGKIGGKGENPSVALGFLHLLAIYGLVDAFNMDEIVDFLVTISKRRQAFDLCRALNVTDKIPDLIQKLINKGNRIQALKFVFEFEMTEKFPPIPLLDVYLEESKDAAKKIRESGKPLNEATMKEISALKSVIKCIEVYKLESEYPKNSLLERIEKLEEERTNKKRAAAAPSPKTQQQSKPKKQSSKPQQQSKPQTQRLSKRSRTNAANSTVQQPHLQLAGSSGTAVATAPFVGPSAGPYGWSGAPLGFPGNPIPSGPNLYPSESHMLLPGYYDRPIDHGGYMLPPQHRPSYYHQ